MSVGVLLTLAHGLSPRRELGVYAFHLPFVFLQLKVRSSGTTLNFLAKEDPMPVLRLLLMDVLAWRAPQRGQSLVGFGRLGTGSPVPCSPACNEQCIICLNRQLCRPRQSLLYVDILWMNPSLLHVVILS